MRTDGVATFLFKGLLAKHSIRDMQSNGLLRQPEYNTQERSDIDLFAPVSDKVRQGSLHMQRCYRLLYILENVVREFVGDVFTEKHGENWFSIVANAAMQKKVRERQQNEKSNQWHSGRNEHPLFYLDFGDLVPLIQNNWDDFKDFLPNQTWAVSRLQDAEKTRNVVAHTNLLNDEEVTRLEMHARDWIRQVR